MQDAKTRLLQMIGMEELLLLGGFIEDSARKDIKAAWTEALPSIAMEMGAGRRRAVILSDLSRMIARKIDRYSYDASKPDLYGQIIDMIEKYLLKKPEEKNEIDGDEDILATNFKPSEW